MNLTCKPRFTSSLGELQSIIDRTKIGRGDRKQTQTADHEALRERCDSLHS